MANNTPIPAMMHDDFGPGDQLRADDVARILNEYAPRNRHDDTLIVLGAFVDHLPLDGYRCLVDDIIACGSDHSQLRAVRNFLVDAVLKPLKTARGRGLKSTEISESPFLEAADEIDDLSGELEPSTRLEQEAIKSQCLLRDGFRCPVSGVYHAQSVIEGHIQLPASRVTAKTECAHVLPFSLRDFEATKTRELNNKATIWYALYRYFPTLCGAIGPGSINQPQNAITMSHDVHDRFGDFAITLDAVPGTTDEYNVTPITTMATIALPIFPVNQVISLSPNDPTIPAPSSGFLEVHARVARILEVSGIGSKIGYLELSYVERIASDGSTDLGGILARQLLTDI